RQEYLDLTNQINAIKLEINPKDKIDMQVVKAFDDMYYAISEASNADPGDAGALASHYISPKPFGQQVRLPKINLFKFDGRIEQWRTFYDTFTSLVHENENITAIDKFHYLISCLSGAALSIANGVPVTSDNYKIVFDALVGRFENKRLLATSYLDKIIQFQQLKSSNINDLL
ncbi:DUF1759 domain-containing protein, partial [Pseudomonas aeruginosa]